VVNSRCYTDEASARVPGNRGKENSFHVLGPPGEGKLNTNKETWTSNFPDLKGVRDDLGTYSEEEVEEDVSRLRRENSKVGREKGFSRKKDSAKNRLFRQGPS